MLTISACCSRIWHFYIECADKTLELYEAFMSPELSRKLVFSTDKERIKILYKNNKRKQPPIMLLYAQPRAISGYSWYLTSFLSSLSTVCLCTDLQALNLSFYFFPYGESVLFFCFSCKAIYVLLFTKVAVLLIYYPDIYYISVFACIYPLLLCDLFFPSLPCQASVIDAELFLLS